MNIKLIKNASDPLLLNSIQMYIDTYSQEPWEDELEYDYVLEYFKNSLENNSDLIIAYEEDKVLALAVVLKVVSYRSNYLRIEDICVDHNLQEKGIGSEFLKLIEDNYDSDVYDVIVLNTIRPFPARYFYEKNGYTIIEDSVTMFKNKM